MITGCLGFLSSLLITVYGQISGLFSLLSFDVVDTFVAFSIFMCGIFAFSFEIQYKVLPDRYYTFMYREWKCLFTPYGRCNCYLFLSILIGSYGNTNNIYSTETYILGIYLTLNALCMMFITWKIKWRLKQVKEENISGQLLRRAFNKADSTKNGQLDLEEFKIFLEDVGIKLEESELEIALIELDRSRNFEISWKEFIEWYCSKGGFLGQ